LVKSVKIKKAKRKNREYVTQEGGSALVNGKGGGCQGIWLETYASGSEKINHRVQGQKAGTSKILEGDGKFENGEGMIEEGDENERGGPILPKLQRPRNDASTVHGRKKRQDAVSL